MNLWVSVQDMRFSKVRWTSITLLLIGTVSATSPLAEPASAETRPGNIPNPTGYWKEDANDPGVVSKFPTPNTVLKDRAELQNRAQLRAKAGQRKMVLFGDLHVHTTYSTDAFRNALPLVHGSRGAFPPADACDYARYIAQLDFYALTDHAENYTPQHWRDGIESVRQCNAVASDSGNPDLTAFFGWEWTQMGVTAKDHFGHHNVILPDSSPGKVPSRPIAAGWWTSKLNQKLLNYDAANKSYYESFIQFNRDHAAIKQCDPGQPAFEGDCIELANTTGELLAKLKEWNLDPLVIPHGTAWGWHTPPSANWATQLKPELHDAERVRLIEVYSGHGNSENYTDTWARKIDFDGEPYCPEPTSNYMPACHQAGEIIRKRCVNAGKSEQECGRRAISARQNYVNVEHVGGWYTVPGYSLEEWLDAGQVRDMFMPAFNYRPGMSVQYGLALQSFDKSGEPLRYRWGFVASTDTHTARPGHGFKQYNRINSADGYGARSQFWRNVLNEIEVRPDIGENPEAQSRDISHLKINVDISAYSFVESAERNSSYYSLGGLAAVHADGRTQDDIWAALQRRETYGTSGQRILLWFDLVNAGGQTVPMGGEVSMGIAPQFQATAVGSFKQKAGCPDYVRKALSARRMERLGDGECYYPSDERYEIVRFEVVRIRPQQFSGEKVESLVEDVWKTLVCVPNPTGCTVIFSDPDFSRDTLYYVRAIQEEIPMINGANQRATFDEDGNAIAVDSCYADYRTELNDECLSDAEPRAWSSPIYVNYEKPKSASN